MTNVVSITKDQPMTPSEMLADLEAELKELGIDVTVSDDTDE